jgi:hypothetical protein
VAFIMCVLLEGDPNVTEYAVDEQLVQAPHQTRQVGE